MSVLEKVKELRDITGAGMQDCKTLLKKMIITLKSQLNI